MKASQSDRQRLRMLSQMEPRCPGKTAGPQGLQWAGNCAMCHRRLATGHAAPVMQPPAEEPCPKYVPFQVEGS